MWTYVKSLQYPVRIKNPNPAAAKKIIDALGGADGELAASTRYLSQRFEMPYNKVVGILTDIGTEELGHVEMVSSIVAQLTRNLTDADIEKGGFADYFTQHTTGIYPCSVTGEPFTAASLQVKGDVFADLHEDLAAEQKARVVYENLLRQTDDPDVADALRFLRAREIVHYQRFGDALRIAQDHADSRNFYAYNPAFDKRCR